MTEKYVSVYPVSFGTRVFMHRNGVIYQAEYRGIKVTEDGICGHNVNTQHIFWLGNKQGEIEVASNISIYTTVQDATQERNAIALNKINIENFSNICCICFGTVFSFLVGFGMDPGRYAERLENV